MRPGTLRRILISNLVSYNSSASTAPILSGIPDNLIEDVKISNCYFGHAGLPTTCSAPGRNAKPYARLAHDPSSRDRRRLSRPHRFGPTPSNGFFIRHLKNLEMSHVEIAHPRSIRAPPSGWKTCIAPTSSPSPRRRKPISHFEMSPTSASSGRAPQRTPRSTR